MTRRPLPPLPTDPFECLCQGCERPWEVATEPFEVARDTYYVGNNWVGAYLLASDDGLALIDTTMQPQIYLVLENIRKLGFDPADIRKILISHMHYDHTGGVRALVEHTGAEVLMSREDWDFMTQHPDQIFTEGYPFGSFTPDGFFDDDRPVQARAAQYPHGAVARPYARHHLVLLRGRGRGRPPCALRDAWRRGPEHDDR
ncbi:hypothetical protein FALB51S_01941 [Frigidibacter albus]